MKKTILMLFLLIANATINSQSVKTYNSILNARQGVRTTNLVVDPNEVSSNISGSVLTVRNIYVDENTNVGQFTDISRNNTVTSVSSQTFGLVSRVTNTSSFSNQGLIGANLIGRDNGTGDLDYVYGTITQADALNSGSIDFLTADVLRTNITGSGASTINIARGLSTDVVLDNANTMVTDLQAMHPSIQLNNGTVDDVVNLYLDLDWDNTGSTTVTGDISYIRAGNDALPTPTGNTYFIKSDVTHPSEFAGSITATDFLGNFNGQPASYYDFREFGLGTGAATNPAFTGDVLTISDTGFRRVSFSASNLPVSENGFLSSIYRVGSFKTYTFISDTGSVYTYAGGQWSKMAKVSDIKNVSNTNSTDLQTATPSTNDAVYTYTIPANSLSVGDVLNLKCYASNPGGATTGGVIFNLGGVGLNISNGLTFSGGTNPFILIDVEVIITSSTSFRYSSSFKIKTNDTSIGNTYTGSVSQDYGGGSFDITTNEDLILQVNNPVNGDVIVKTISVKHFKS